MASLRLSSIVPCVVVLLCILGWSQSESASLSGFVTDPSGAAIVGAQVKITEVRTEISSTTSTNSVGLYLFTNLHPGEYRLSVSSLGFKQAIRQGLSLHVQDTISQNFKLEIGSTTETVSVVADQVLVNTTDATVKTVVDQKLIQELPLNGRSLQTLFELTPGVTVATASFANQGQFSVNGQRTDANYLMVDGASANFGIPSGNGTGQSFGGALPALSVSGGTNSLVSTDAVEEFALQTSSYAPEFGRTPGGQISIVTRAGTNKFHGSGYDYLRNDVLDANDWFAGSKHLTKPKERQNDFGGTLGGPIIRNKTFFFFSYEGLRLRQPTTVLSDVPTLTIRNSAPAAIQPYLKAFPLPSPNGVDHGNGLAEANYGISNPAQLDASSLRLDHHVKESLAMFVRYNYAPSDSATRGSGQALSVIPLNKFSTQTLTLGVNYVVNPKMTGESRLNWSRSLASSIFEMDSFAGAVPLNAQGLFPPIVTGDRDVFSFQFLNGRSAQLSLGPNANNSESQINLIENLCWQKGTHFLKGGGDYRRLKAVSGPEDYLQGDAFAGVPSVMAGNANIVVLISTAGKVPGIVSNYSLFGEDTWKPISRLTITYGLRWDYNPAPTLKSASGLVPLVLQNTNNLSAVSIAPLGSPLFTATSNNLAPRVGFAYRVPAISRTDSVIRAGFGTFYDLGNGLLGSVLRGYPFFNQSIIVKSQPFPLSPSAAAPPVVSSNGPFPRIQAFPQNFKQPYVYHWNVSYEQAMGTDQSVTIGYVGSAGHSLVRGLLFVPPIVPSSFTGISLASNTGYSNYNALQISFRRRTTNRLNILASYTYGHSLDNSSDDQGANAPPQFVTPRSDYGASDFDIRHLASAAVDYQLPRFQESRLGRAVFGGWGINTLFTARTPPPVNVTITRTLSFGQYSLRPDLVPGVPLYISSATVPGGRIFNPNAFSDPVSASQGTLTRNVLRAFPLVQDDLSIRRSFSLTEKVQLEARVEAFNVFNHPNFAPPSGVLGTETSPGHVVIAPSFGSSAQLLNNGLTSGTAVGGVGFSSLYQLGGPRSLQLALKISF
jgi:hypothetical protein